MTTDQDIARVRAAQRRIQRLVGSYARHAYAECGHLEPAVQREHFEALIIVGLGNLRNVAGAPVAAATTKAMLEGLEDQRQDAAQDDRPSATALN